LILHQAKAPPQEPVLAPATPVAAAAPRATSSPSAIYEGFKAQRDVLNDQLHDLERTRSDITSQMEEASDGSPEQKSLQGRLTDVDARIKAVDQMIAGNSMQLAQAAAIPGAVVPPPPYVPQGPPDEVYVLAGLFFVVVLMPLSIAFAKRIWRRSATVITSLPRELTDRLLRLEQTVEATSFEVERIGEGQRFLTKLFTEGEGARALGTGAAKPIEVKSPNVRERLP
jgi:hypothetical protein